MNNKLRSWSDQDYDTLKELLVGRKVVGATEKLLTLDNGTQLEVGGNQGCGGCSSGWFEVTELNTCDNIITAVEYEADDHVVSLFVYAEDNRVKLVEANGDIGNGYYGSGFWIRVSNLTTT